MQKAGLGGVSMSMFDEIKNLDAESKTSVLYFASAIIWDRSRNEPSLLSISTGKVTLEEAVSLIENLRRDYCVLSAWVDLFNDTTNPEEAKIVFHECYVNAVGYVEPV